MKPAKVPSMFDVAAALAEFTALTGRTLTPRRLATVTGVNGCCWIIAEHAADGTLIAEHETWNATPDARLYGLATRPFVFGETPRPRRAARRR